MEACDLCNDFTDIFLVTTTSSNYHHNYSSIIDDNNKELINLLMKHMRKTITLRANQLTSECVEYLRIAVRVKRRSYSELNSLAPKYVNDWLLNWLAVRSFGLASFRCIKNESFKSDREIIKAGLEKNGSILFECNIPIEELKNDDELLIKGLETCNKVWELANERIVNDRALVESALKRDGLLFKYCGESLKYDMNLIGIALKQNIESCKIVPTQILDEKSALGVVIVNGLLLAYFPQYLSNRIVVTCAVNQNGNALEYASNELKADEEIVKLALRNNADAIEFASPTLLNRKDFMNYFLNLMRPKDIISVKVSDIIKKYADYQDFMITRYETGIEFPRDPSTFSIQIWLRVLSKTPHKLQIFSKYHPTLLKDISFLLRLATEMKINFKDSYSDYLELQKDIICNKPELLRYFDESLKFDFEFMIRLLDKSDFWYHYFDKSISNNMEFLLRFLNKDPYNWSYVSIFNDELFEFGVKDSHHYFGIYLSKYCNNKEYILRAIKMNPKLFSILSKKLDENDRIQFKPIETTPLPQPPQPSTLSQDRIEKLSTEEKKNKKLIIGHLKISPMSFPYIDDSLKTDMDVVMTAINKHGGVLKFLSSEMKKNKEIVMASKQLGFAYADKTLQRDREVILNAAKYYGGILELLDKDLKNDREIVLQCIKTTPKSFEFASESLRNDLEIVRIAITLDPTLVEFTDLCDFK